MNNDLEMFVSKNLLFTHDVAKLLNVTRQSVSVLTKKKVLIPLKRSANCTVYLLEDVLKYQENKKNKMEDENMIELNNFLKEERLRKELKNELKKIGINVRYGGAGCGKTYSMITRLPEIISSYDLVMIFDPFNEYLQFAHHVNCPNVQIRNNDIHLMIKEIKNQYIHCASDLKIYCVIEDGGLSSDDGSWLAEIINTAEAYESLHFQIITQDILNLKVKNECI